MVEQAELRGVLENYWIRSHSGTTLDYDQAEKIVRITEDGRIDAPTLDFELKPTHRSKDGRIPGDFGQVGSFSAIGSGLTTLEGCPRYVLWTLAVQMNPLHDLEHLPERAHAISLDYNDKMGLLRLLMVKKLADVNLVSKWVMRQYIARATAASDIINRYLGKGRAGVMPCAAELHKAGFSGNARL